jgi:hypothetical protein
VGCHPGAGKIRRFPPDLWLLLWRQSAKKYGMHKATARLTAGQIDKDPAQFNMIA